MLSSEAKKQRLSALCTPRGTIAALAMDQRKSLRRMIAEASGRPLEEISDGQLSEFKTAVTEILTPFSSAVLLDPEYGLHAAQTRASNCGLLMTYEADGYENPRPHRMLALMPDYSVQRLRDLGADGIKILLHYSPYDDSRANDEKKVMIERIGAECAALRMPFFLEPVGYDPTGSWSAFDYARRKPEIVLHLMEEFSKEVYRVDVLKVEFPVDALFVEGSAVFGGRTAHSRSTALDYFREVDRVARKPYVYLSAGVSTRQFAESLRLAAEAGARFSGVLCGRATWQDGIPAYVSGGLPALREWLESGGRRNIEAINNGIGQAVSLDKLPTTAL